MKQKQIIIVGGGFWAALGAARKLSEAKAEDVQITLISPEDALVIRPRLYESDLSGVRVPLSAVLSPVGVEHRRALVHDIDTESRELALGGRSPSRLLYDQLVLCAGSKVRLPDGAEGVHCVDSYEQARALHEALAALGERPGAPFNATVIGAGFTGLELAAELSDMLRAAARRAGASDREASVLLLDRADTVAPEFGPRARAIIEGALGSLGVRARTGVSVSRVDREGVTLAGGERIDAGLTAWAAGPRASALNEQLGMPLDDRGRLPVDSRMATGAQGVWAAGDAARVSVDGKHLAMMSCQQAMPQGHQAGENAAGGDLSGAYPNPRLRANSVSATTVADGSLIGEDIADNTLTSVKIQDGSLSAPDFSSGSVRAASPGEPIEVVGNGVPIAENQVKEAKVSCPVGRRLLSGGFEWKDNAKLGDTIIATGPDIGQNLNTDWEAVGRVLKGGEANELRAIAPCLLP